jgi:hypothetical protein
VIVVGRVVGSWRAAVIGLVPASGIERVTGTFALIVKRATGENFLVQKGRQIGKITQA